MAEQERQVIERGIFKCGEYGYYYKIEIDETGQKRKYIFRPGECIELDPENDEMTDLVYFSAPPRNIGREKGVKRDKSKTI